MEQEFKLLGIEAFWDQFPDAPESVANTALADKFAESYAHLMLEHHYGVVGVLLDVFYIAVEEEEEDASDEDFGDED